MMRDKNRLVERRENGTLRVATVPVGETLTQQQFIDQCDVNKIVAKFKKTGEWTHLHGRTGVYGDFDEMPSYFEATQTIARAREAFEVLPSELRTRFGNDPQALMDFLADEKNMKESIDLGLRTEIKQPTPDPMLETLREVASNTKPRKSTKSE